LPCPRRRIRLRLKTSVTVVLLISVFISSCLLVHSAHAQGDWDLAVGQVVVYPYVGYCNPLANSGLWSYASGFLDNSYSVHDSDGDWYSQEIMEAAVYANGNEPMAFAAGHGSSSRYGAQTQAVAAFGGWPYLIFNKTTGKPLANYYQSIPVDLNYSMSLSASGSAAYAEGWVGIYGLYGPRAHRFEAAGGFAYMSGGDPATGTFHFYGYGGSPLYIIVGARTITAAAMGSSRPPGSAEAQAVVESHLSIDPSSPLAGQLQVYAAKTANATANDLSEWTPLGNTPPTTPTSTTPTPPTRPTPTPTPTPNLVTISKYYGIEVYVKHANSAEWIVLPDPKKYDYQEGDTLSTVKQTIIQIDLGRHGYVTLDPDSTIFIHTVSESDVTFSVTGNFYQTTSDKVTIVDTVVNGVPVHAVTDTASESAGTSPMPCINGGDPQYTVTATNTSTLIRVYEGVVTLNDSSGHSVSIGAGNQSSITLNQAPATPEPMNDTTPPSVLSVFPVSYEPSINESMPISVTFSKAIDPSSAAGSNFTITDSKGASVSGDWTVLYQTVIFTPQSSLPVGTYVVDVKGGSQGVRDLSGNALLSDYTFTFTGGASERGGSSNPLGIDFGSTAFILIVVAVAVVIIIAVVLVARKLSRTRSVSKLANQVAHALLCPKCGKALPKPNAKFCPFCGEALKTGE
jgi:hypothetical protein